MNTSTFSDNYLIRPLCDKIVFSLCPVPLREFENLAKLNYKKFEFVNQGFDSLERMESAFKFLENMEMIEELFLIDCDIDDQSLSILVSILKNRKEKLIIKHLKLNHNKLGATSVGVLIELINHSEIESLDLSDNPHLKYLSALFIYLEDVEKLKKLVISRIELDKEDREQLCKLINNSKKLTSIDLSNNRWIPTQIKSLSESFFNNKNLIYLNLKDNNIPFKNFRIFCEALGGSFKRESLKLKTLNLENCKICTNSVAALGEALETNRSLENLNMSKIYDFNPLFFQSLAKNAFLKNVNLSYATMNNRNIQALANSMNPNGSFSPTRLNFSNAGLCTNNLSFQEFLTACSNTKTLETLNLSNTKITEFTKIQLIAEYISKNPVKKKFFLILL